LQKLQQKKFAITDIQTVLTQLIAENLLSNTRFVTNFIHYRRNRGYGPLYIQRELTQKGIAKDMIEEHLSINDNAWFDCVQNVWQKRFKNQIPQDFKARVKQMRFLQQRGFTREQIEHFFLKILAI
jgi:regulatory protein